VQLLDVTDFVEFLGRGESVSGVQRVIAEVSPRLTDIQPVVLDRARGEFIALTPTEVTQVHNLNAAGILDRARTAQPVTINPDTILVFLGALWISDALMLAARDAHAKGAKLVVLLYDLTPVLDAQHTAAVNRLFERYLSIAGQLASRVPAISQSSRNDFTTYCEQHNWQPPQGAATGLPPGITPTTQTISPWPRPYALFVGTIEGRKNHMLALQAWQQLDNPPDLVCIGRLGWNANEFLHEYITTNGLNGKVSVLTSGVTDEQLAAFYEHAEFAIYPSQYEGWGLPVSESLAFGKLPIVANNSSLPEAGLDLAVYFDTDDLDSFVTAITTHALDPVQREQHEARIRAAALTNANDTTWDHVAYIIMNEIEAARHSEPRRVMPPLVELGHEYTLGNQSQAPDAAYADKYLDHLAREGLTPLLHQQPKPDDLLTVDSALIGEFGSPQTWGYELRPGKSATFTITRPTSGDLTVHFATRSMPGKATVSSTGPGGPTHQDLYLGSVLSFPLGAGSEGESAMVVFHVTDATDSIEGFLGLRSFVVMESADLNAEVMIQKAAAQALRQELDYMTNTRSWKVTEPLRKWKGRGSQ